MTDTSFPVPLENDAEDVVIALKSARSLWESADYTEASRWLRKAAAAAQEAGDDPRALELAKLASDVESAPAASPRAAPADAPLAAPSMPTASSAEPTYTQAIRVAVKRSVRDGDLFVARLLENQPVPSGSHEAFLVLTNPNLDLFDPSAS